MRSPFSRNFQIFFPVFYRIIENSKVNVSGCKPDFSRNSNFFEQLCLFCIVETMIKKLIFTFYDEKHRNCRSNQYQNSGTIFLSKPEHRKHPCNPMQRDDFVKTDCVLGAVFCLPVLLASLLTTSGKHGEGLK